MTDSAIVIPSAREVELVAAPRPFGSDVVRVQAPEGCTVLEMLEAAGIGPALLPLCHVTIAGHMIPRENWHRLRPKAGVQVVAKVVPAGGQGGGGKTALRLVAMIAVMVVAAYVSGGALAPSLGSAFQAGGIGATLGAGVISPSGAVALGAGLVAA